LPLDGTKGELFIIKAAELVLDVIVNTSVFILPLGIIYLKLAQPIIEREMICQLKKAN
jgi:hypothetical protein